MEVGIIGVNFKSADLFFREKLAQNLQKNSNLLQSRCFTQVVLSTCNRFEIYFSSKDLTETHSQLLQEFRNEFESDCGFKLYSYFGKDCFFHLSKVTAGLDSAILVETEIQGQVKRAYLKAQEKALSKELHFIFQKSLKIGKFVRSQIELRPGMPNLTISVLNCFKSLLQDVVKPKILLVGTSEINMKILSEVDLTLYDVTICSRSAQRSEEKARQYAVKSILWEDLKNWTNYDGLIFATNYPGYLLKGKYPQINNQKIIIDLSVPRNVHPQLAENTQIQLLNIDQVNKLVRRYRKLKGETLCDLGEQIQKSVMTQYQIFKNKNQFAESALSVI